MNVVKIHELVKKRALITRESANVIARAVAEVPSGESEIILDFAGVDAVTPSFVDETLRVLEGALGEKGWLSLRVVFLNPPTRLSSKFAAVGRARRLQISEAEDGAWVITAELAPHVT